MLNKELRFLAGKSLEDVTKVPYGFSPLYEVVVLIIMLTGLAIYLAWQAKQRNLPKKPRRT